MILPISFSWISGKDQADSAVLKFRQDGKMISLTNDVAHKARTDPTAYSGVAEAGMNVAMAVFKNRVRTSFPFSEGILFITQSHLEWKYQMHQLRERCEG